MTEWRELRLGDVCELKRGYDLPSSERRHGRVPVVSSSGPTGWHDTPKVRAPGVVTGRYGTLGNVYFVEEDYWPLNTALYVRDFRGNDPRFVFYMLTTANLGASEGAAAVPGLNRNVLHELTVRCPDVRVQQRVASVLTAFDDLIENNRRRIEIVEETARSIFREWFVRFRFPGHDSVESVESPLGPIPAGWTVRRLGDVCRSMTDAVDPQDVDPELPAVGLEHLPRRSTTLTEWGWAKELGSRKYRFLPGDVLFGKIRPYFHKVAYAPMEGICSTDAIVLRAEDAEVSNLVLAVASSDEFVANAVAISSGTKMPRANWDILADYRVVVPPWAQLKRWASGLGDLVQAAATLASLNRSLIISRDRILPRLVTGQIEVDSLGVDDVFGWAEAAVPS